MSVVGFLLWVAVGNSLLAYGRRRWSVRGWYRSASVGVAVILLGLVTVGAVRASSPDVREANKVLSTSGSRHLFGRLPLRALLAETAPGERVALRLGSESAWEVMVADALQLAGHGRDVRVIRSPVTRFLFDDSMLVGAPQPGTVLVFSERQALSPQDAGSVVATQGRWAISRRARP